MQGGWSWEEHQTCPCVHDLLAGHHCPEVSLDQGGCGNGECSSHDAPQTALVCRVPSPQPSAKTEFMECKEAYQTLLSRSGRGGRGSASKPPPPPGPDFWNWDLKGFGASEVPEEAYSLGGSAHSPCSQGSVLSCRHPAGSVDDRPRPFYSHAL